MLLILGPNSDDIQISPSRCCSSCMPPHRAAPTRRARGAAVAQKLPRCPAAATQRQWPSGLRDQQLHRQHSDAAQPAQQRGGTSLAPSLHLSAPCSPYPPTSEHRFPFAREMPAATGPRCGCYERKFDELSLLQVREHKHTLRFVTEYCSKPDNFRIFTFIPSRLLCTLMNTFSLVGFPGRGNVLSTLAAIPRLEQRSR